MSRIYRAAEREAALDLYAGAGPSAAARKTGIPKSTIQRWARKSGLSVQTPSSRPKRPRPQGKRCRPSGRTIDGTARRRRASQATTERALHHLCFRRQGQHAPYGEGERAGPEGQAGSHGGAGDLHRQAPTVGASRFPGRPGDGRGRSVATLRDREGPMKRGTVAPEKTRAGG